MRALVAPLVLFALVGCEKRTTDGPSTDAAPSSGPKVTAANTPVDENTILLGEVGSLTGAQATFGQSTANGIQMAIDEVNAAGGLKLPDGGTKKLAVRVYDDQGKPEEAAAATTRLINQDKVKVILGEVASSNSLAMAPKAQAAGVPMITPSSTNPKVTEVGDYIFRVCFIDDFQGTVMAKFALDKGWKKVALLKDNKSDYSLGLTRFFREAFTKGGGEIVAEEAYSQGDTDFRGQLTAIKGKRPDAIYVPGYYNDVGVIARQARELGIKVPLLGGDGWESEKLYELAGNALDGSFYTNHYSADDPSPTVQNFISAYKEKYKGAMPDSLAALGYDAAMVAIRAMERAKDLSGASIRDEIAKTKNHPGIAGNITLNAKRDAEKPAVVLQVQGNKSVYVATVNP
jgi:branched-chain amino acid transport system substrate-binding protein